MSSPRYQRVNAVDDDGHSTTDAVYSVPHSNIASSSPPPSFRSRSRSPSPSPSWRLLRDRSSSLGGVAEDRMLEEAFGDGGDSDAEDEPDDRQQLMRANPPSLEAAHSRRIVTASSTAEQVQSPEQTTPGVAMSLPAGTTATPGLVINSSNDGVFANLAAKPERGEKNEDLPPTYEEAAADATPPYWETTIMAPGISSNEVYVDGLPVGSIFSFIWNAMISMSFQLVGFLLTYLLHTTHAAKNGSRAGLGLTLVQYGFYMKSGSQGPEEAGSDPYVPPPDPNSHNFDPNSIADGAAGAASSGGPLAISTSEWISYVLMIVGWFILIRAISDFLRARRHEQLVLQSPQRGLSVPVVAEDERAETVV